MFNLYWQNLSRLLISFLLSAISSKVTLQSSIPLSWSSFQVLIKVFLINFLWFTRLWYFTQCIIIVIKTTAKIRYIASYILFRTRATVKFMNSKICLAICDPFKNIVFIPISIFKLMCLLSILTNLGTSIITSSTFKFFGIYVTNFCSYQTVLKGASFTLTSLGRLLPKNNLVFHIR